MHVPFTTDLPSIPLLTAGLLKGFARSELSPCTREKFTMGDGYAKTGIVEFPLENTVFVCVVVLRPRLTSMVISGRLVNLTKLFLDRLRPSCTYFRQ